MGDDRDEHATRTIAAGLDGYANAVSVDEAVQRADALAVAVWLPDFEQFIAQYADLARGSDPAPSGLGVALSPNGFAAMRPEAGGGPPI